MGGVVAGVHANAEPLEIADTGQVGITAGDGDASPNEQLGERAHARASDAHEVDRPRVARTKKSDDFGVSQGVCSRLHGYALYCMKARNNIKRILQVYLLQ